MMKLAYPNYEVKTKLKPASLDGFSNKIIDQHWMLYKGYVTNVNLLNKTIWDCLSSGEALSEPKMAEVQRRLGFEYNGMVLHEYYFEALKNGVRHIAGFKPIVVMDVWEHAYVTDYGANNDGRAAYIEAFFRNLNWDVIAKRSLIREPCPPHSRRDP